MYIYIYTYIYIYIHRASWKAVQSRKPFARWPSAHTSFAGSGTLKAAGCGTAQSGREETRGTCRSHVFFFVNQRVHSHVFGHQRVHPRVLVYQRSPSAGLFEGTPQIGGFPFGSLLKPPKRGAPPKKGPGCQVNHSQRKTRPISCLRTSGFGGCQRCG